MMWKRCLVFVALLAVTMTSATAQRRGNDRKPEKLSNPKQVRWWRGSYDEAFKEAAARNVPVLIAVIQDGEEANERLVDGMLKNKVFVAATEKTVAIVTSKKNHGNKRQDIDGRALQACKRMGHVPCETHQRQEAEMYYSIFEGKSVKTPQVMLLLPDEERTLVGRVIDVAGQGSYTSLINKACKKLGPGFLRRDFEAAKELLQLAKAARARQLWGKTWKHATELVASGGQTSTLVVEAKKLLEEVTAHAEKELEAVDAKVKAGDLWAAFDMVDRIIADFEGAAVHERAVAKRKKMARTKEGKKVARGLKKQKRYLKDLAKAEKYEDDNDFIKARSTYEKIVSKAKGLPVAKVAAERIEAMKKDPDIRELLERADKEDEASRLMRKADGLHRKGQYADARKIYEQIVKDFAGTKAAKRAEKKLDG